MLFLVPLTAWISGLVLAVVPVRSRAALGSLAAAGAAATLALAAVAVAGDWNGSVRWSGALGLTAGLTPLSAAVSLLVALVTVIVVIYAAAHETARGLRRLLALMLVFLGAMELLVAADDFLTLLVGWELVGACSWALIGHEWRGSTAPRSATYAFVATRLGDAGLVVAAIATWAASGGFAFAGLDGLPAEAATVVATGVLVSAAAKSAQVPFSPWLFRAMHGPSSVSALLHSATMVAAGAYLVARLEPWLGASTVFVAGTVLVGLVTALGGGITALLQPHAKRLLAASTSAQYGLMFVAAGAGYPAVAVAHMVAHAVMKGSLFLATGIAGERAGGFGLARMGFLAALPWTALAALTGALALAGVPPLGAAWTKEAVSAAARGEAVWVGAGVLVASGLSAAYAARYQVQAFGPPAGAEGEDDDPDGQDDKSPPGPRTAEVAALWSFAALTLLSALLWVPAIGEAAGRALGGPIPHPGPVGTALSLGLVALGLLAGQAVARRHPTLGSTGSAAVAADWLGLPGLVDALVCRPFARLADTAAKADDRVFDAIPRSVARGARALSDASARADGGALDALPRGVARASRALAAAGSRGGEFLADGLPTGLAVLAGQTGGDLRRLQTGLSHHYYAIVAVGLAAMALLLIAGS